MKTAARLWCAVPVAFLVACAAAPDYRGVDPEVLEDCRLDATSTKGLLDSWQRGGPERDAYADNSAQTAIDQARLGKDMLKNESRNPQAAWPIAVLINQCLIEFGQPVPEAAVLEIERWVSGDLP